MITIASIILYGFAALMGAAVGIKAEKYSHKELKGKERREAQTILVMFAIFFLLAIILQVHG